MKNSKDPSFADKKNPGSYPEIWRIAYPLVLMNASHTIMQFVDRKFLSEHATEDVAAAVPAGILSFTLFSFFVVTTGFTSAVVSQFHGSDDHKSCARAPWAGFYFALFAGLVCSYIVIHLGFFLIELGGHHASLLNRELTYLGTLLPSAGFACLGAAFCAFFSGRGKTIYVTFIQFSACALNIGLDYVMIFGRYGCPQMGIGGAGLATTLSTVFSFSLAATLFLGQNQKIYPTRNFLDAKWDDLKRLIKFGSPCGMQVLLEVGSFTFVVFIIGHLGDVALTATNIALSIGMIAFLPLLGLSEATSIVVARYIGAERKDVSEKVAYRCWHMASVYMIIMALIFIFLPEPLINFFAPPNAADIDFSNVLSIGTSILICMAIYNFFDATLFTFMGALRGAGDTSYPMWVVCACGWGILVPGTLLLIKYFNGSVVQVWIFMSCYLLILCLIIFFRFRSGKWKKVDMLEEHKGEDQVLSEAEAIWK